MTVGAGTGEGSAVGVGVGTGTGVAVGTGVGIGTRASYISIFSVTIYYIITVMIISCLNWLVNDYLHILYIIYLYNI